MTLVNDTEGIERFGSASGCGGSVVFWPQRQMFAVIQRCACCVGGVQAEILAEDGRWHLVYSDRLVAAGRA